MANLGQLNEGDELSAVPSLPSWLLQVNEDQFVYALERVIDRPDLTERDKRILSLVEKEGSSNLLESRKYFEAETMVFARSASGTSTKMRKQTCLQLSARY